MIGLSLRAARTNRPSCRGRMFRSSTLGRVTARKRVYAIFGRRRNALDQGTCVPIAGSHVVASSTLLGCNIQPLAFLSRGPSSFLCFLSFMCTATYYDVLFRRCPPQQITGTRSVRESRGCFARPGELFSFVHGYTRFSFQELVLTSAYLPPVRPSRAASREDCCRGDVRGHRDAWWHTGRGALRPRFRCGALGAAPPKAASELRTV